MENQNDYLQKLQESLKGFEKKEKENGKRNSSSRKNLLAKMFVPREDKELFRILPPADSNSLKFTQEAFFHEVQLNMPAGKKAFGKKVYCPAHNNPKVQQKDTNGEPVFDQEGNPVMVPEKCPLCEKAKTILKRQDQSIKGKKKDELTPSEKEIWDKNVEIFKEANKWEAKKFYIIKGIDKGNPKEGVKFWRFKKNYKNQGTLEKIFPAITQFIDMHQKPFFDVDAGCDLNITVIDSSLPNGRKYRSISAIIPNQPSKLNDDPLVVRQWLNDPITWRDVFKPKTAPGITPLQYLEFAAEGNDPYWDDSDSNNKKWVFPGRPDLEEAANTRDRDNDASDNYENFEQASDISNDGVTINNVTKSDVGNYNDANVPSAVDATSVESTTQTQTESSTQQVETTTDSYNDPSNSDDGGEDYDDLPF